MTTPWTIVECSRGGLFSTKWVPFASFKAIRLGNRRLQRCPIHKRFEMIHRVDPSTVTAADRDAALAIQDSQII